LLGVCHRSCFLWPSFFIYSSVRDSLPPQFWHLEHPTLFAMFLLLLLLLLIIQFFFFPWVGVGLSRGLC
jgi:hypothetical protein